MFKEIKKEFSWGKHQVKIETGTIARQASGSILIDVDGTTILVTAVAVNDPSKAKDFFPLTVNYMEKSYALGKVPGGFFKREGRPAERETLTARLIDRPIRPLFPKDYKQEIQVVATVVSINPLVNPDIPAIIGSSAVLAISGVPFSGPVGACRIGYIDNEFVLNPSNKELESSMLDLVVAGTKSAVLMVESDAKELSEEVMLKAVMFGHESYQPVIEAVNEFAAEVNAGKAPTEKWQAPAINNDLNERLINLATDRVRAAYDIADKLERQEALKQLRDSVQAEILADDAEATEVEELSVLFSKLEKSIVRSDILAGKKRIDGRDCQTVRPINIKTSVLPRTHGSALFTRGETQALVVATLGTEKDAQLVEHIDGEKRESFMLHYNFPPYCVGETGMVGAPKRREIGHGRLAHRSIRAVLPDMSRFPYTLRVVSEITESNGSSSMASVCGTSLALMDAGVPLTSPVAGIAMGLIKDDNDFKVLTDILGDEDHLGDMDFKVAGTANGITALQMDIKIEGINEEIMKIALEQACAGRMHILEKMNEILSEARQDISQFAPRILVTKVNPDKIKDIIGKGGATIRQLTEETGTTIDIKDDGTVRVASIDRDAGLEAKRRIELITADAEVGKIYRGRVVKIVDFGAFVNFLPGKDGLVHISQISHENVSDVKSVLKENQYINVTVLEIDKQGRVRLSMKDIEQPVVDAT